MHNYVQGINIFLGKIGKLTGLPVSVVVVGCVDTFVNLQMAVACVCVWGRERLERGE